MRYQEIFYLLAIAVIMINIPLLAMAESTDEPPTVELGPDITVEVGVEINFIEYMKIDDPDSYLLKRNWDFDSNVDSDDDGIKDNDNEEESFWITKKYDKPGTYIVTLTVSDSTNEVKDTMKVTVIEKQGETDQIFNVDEELKHSKVVQRDGWMAYKLELHYDSNVTIEIDMKDNKSVLMIMIKGDSIDELQAGQSFKYYESSPGARGHLKYYFEPTTSDTYYLVVINFKMLEKEYSDFYSNSFVEYTLSIKVKGVDEGARTMNAALSGIGIPAVLIAITAIISSLFIRKIKKEQSSYTPEKQAKFNKLATPGRIIGLVGGIIVIISLFLPWIPILGLPIPGILLHPFSYLLLIFAVISLVLLFTKRKALYYASLASGVTTAGIVYCFLGFILAGLYFQALDTDIFWRAILIGPYIAIIGSFVLIAGVVISFKEFKDAQHPSQLSVPRSAQPYYQHQPQNPSVSIQLQQEFARQRYYEEYNKVYGPKPKITTNQSQGRFQPQAYAPAPPKLPKRNCPICTSDLTASGSEYFCYKCNKKITREDFINPYGKKEEEYKDPYNRGYRFKLRPEPPPMQAPLFSPTLQPIPPNQQFQNQPPPVQYPLQLTPQTPQYPPRPGPGQFMQPPLPPLQQVIPHQQPHFQQYHKYPPSQPMQQIPPQSPPQYPSEPPQYPRQIPPPPQPPSQHPPQQPRQHRQIKQDSNY